MPAGNGANGLPVRDRTALPHPPRPADPHTMTSVRQPLVAGAVEFADGTTDARSRTAAGPLGRATLATLQAPPILPARPWRWRLHHATAELWLPPTRLPSDQPGTPANTGAVPIPRQRR